MPDLEKTVMQLLGIKGWGDELVSMIANPEEEYRSINLSSALAELQGRMPDGELPSVKFKEPSRRVDQTGLFSATYSKVSVTRPDGSVDPKFLLDISSNPSISPDDLLQLLGTLVPVLYSAAAVLRKSAGGRQVLDLFVDLPGEDLVYLDRKDGAKAIADALGDSHCAVVKVKDRKTVFNIASYADVVMAKDLKERDRDASLGTKLINPGDFDYTGRITIEEIQRRLQSNANLFAVAPGPGENDVDVKARGMGILLAS